MSLEGGCRLSHSFSRAAAAAAVVFVFFFPSVGWGCSVCFFKYQHGLCKDQYKPASAAIWTRLFSIWLDAANTIRGDNWCRNSLCQPFPTIILSRLFRNDTHPSFGVSTELKLSILAGGRTLHSCAFCVFVQRMKKKKLNKRCRPVCDLPVCLSFGSF